METLDELLRVDLESGLVSERTLGMRRCTNMAGQRHDKSVLIYS